MSVDVKAKRVLLSITTIAIVLVCTAAFIHLRRPSFSITRSDTPHYDAFKRLFTEKWHNELVKMLEDGSKSADNSSVYKSYEKEIVDIVVALNYNLIFTSNINRKSLIDRSNEYYIKSFDIQKANAAAAGIAIESILTSSEIIDGLAISYSQIDSINAIDFSGFTISSLIEPFCIFTNAEKADFSDTKIGNDLGKLSTLKKLKDLYAKNNNTTKIEDMWNFQALRSLHLQGNQISSVDINWLKTNDRITIFLKPKPGMSLGSDIYGIAKNYPKVVIESTAAT